ncbi:NnrU family protein [Paracoccus sp. S-4012]|uniref:NnrU family protein n=1 Tax=Paracoccus sp. S-4012 TaxID=2665648 RepID=UPI0012B0AB4A|nr:NnrU family protein [Paracoccus sp. S-4012]MRX49635.1 NnrU family protein [Paracoccus sp. S-4012]
MSGWLPLLAAFALFLAAHAIPMRPDIRGPLVGALGRRGYLVLYSLLSIGLLYLLILAVNAAPRVTLWAPALWQRWLVNLAMPAAILLAAFGIGAPNPFGVTGKAEGFDPARPGIAGITRHPLMWAFALWAGAHLVANGELAHVLFFGAMLVFALMGLAAGEARARRLPDFRRLAVRTSLLPGAALLTGRWQPRGWPSPLRLGIAVVVWLGLLYLHPPLIGAVALP